MKNKSTHQISYAIGYRRCKAKCKESKLIDKACKWLDNVNTDVYMDSGIFQMTDMIMDFKKAMEEKV